MAGLTFTGVTDAINPDDPFSDRKHGPRTRSRASKEASEASVSSQIKKGKKGKSDPVPTHASFAKLPPAAFPSLDAGLPAAAHENTRRRQELEKVAQQQVNPFVNNDGLYFGLPANSEAEVGVSSVSGQKEQEKVAEQKKVSLSGTSQKRRLEEAEPAENKSKRLKTRDTRESAVAVGTPVSYKTTLTHNSISGELVRWHKRVKSKDPPNHPQSKKNTNGKEGEDHKEEDDLSAVPPADSDDDEARLSEYLEKQLQLEMTENATSMANSDDSTRGMPYYERLKKILKAQIKQKQDLDESLAKIEQSIWNKEAAYLDETVAGNIMKGFDNYIKASGTQSGSTSGGGTASRKKVTVSEQDRLFSRSSVGFWGSMQEGSPHVSSNSTPSHAPTPKGLSDHPTPTSTTSTKAPSLKKKRPDEDVDGKPSNKRLKITFSRNDKD